MVQRAVWPVTQGAGVVAFVTPKSTESRGQNSVDRGVEHKFDQVGTSVSVDHVLPGEVERCCSVQPTSPSTLSLKACSFREVELLVELSADGDGQLAPFLAGGTVIVPTKTKTLPDAWWTGLEMCFGEVQCSRRC